MDPRTEELLKRPVYAYDIPPEILNSITLKDAPTTAEAQETDVTPAQEDPASSSNESVVGSRACSLCGLSFTSLDDQRGHLKSDLHHYNLKQKLRGRKPVSENDFEKLIADLDESLSGSDSSDSDENSETDARDSTLSALLKKQATLAEKQRSENDGPDEEAPRKKRGAAPLLWFSSPLLPENSYFGLYKALLTDDELKDDSAVAEIVKKKQLEPVAAPRPAKDGTLPEVAYKGPHIFLCMIGGGHFAAMVVSLSPRKGSHTVPMNREATVLAHKTFHRYTTRRKQGGAQSANDSSKGTAHSAGSGLRRANEAALVEDVRAVLHDWKALLDTSDLLFIRASGTTNRRTIFGPYEGQALRSNDPRIRGFPFNTKRATQKELMRSFIELTRLKVREIVPVDETKPQAAPPKLAAAPKPTKPALPEEEETALLHTSQLQAMIRRSKLPALLNYLKTNELSADFRFQPPEQNYHAPSPLHLAASHNAGVLVTGLLCKAGADPTVENKEGRTPFELAGDRSTRDAFRVSRSELGPKWDWDAARVPSPLTKAEAEQREEREGKEAEEAEKREKERRKAEEARLEREGPQVGRGKKRLGVMGVAGAMKSAEDKREEESRGLSPEMRMKLERERRARAAEERIRRMQGK